MTKHQSYVLTGSLIITLSFAFNSLIPTFAAAKKKKDNTPKCVALRSQYASTIQNLTILRTQLTTAQRKQVKGIKSKISKANKDLKNKQRSYNSLGCLKLLMLPIGPQSPVSDNAIVNTPQETTMPINPPSQPAPAVNNETTATGVTTTAKYGFSYEFNLQFTGDDAQGGTVSCAAPKINGVGFSPGSTPPQNFKPTLVCGAPLALTPIQYKSVYKTLNSIKSSFNWIEVSKERCTINLHLRGNLVEPGIGCN